MAEKLRKAEADKRRLEAENRKLRAGQGDEDEDAPVEDEEMDDEFKSKEDWDRVIEKAEADAEHAKAMLKKWPKEQKYLLQAEEAKTQIESAREKIGELRSPSDQLRHAVGRKKKVTGRLAKLEEDIVAKALRIVEDQDELGSMREQFHEGQEELQAIESKLLLLVTPAGAPPPPMDVAVCVEAMRSDLGRMFDDPRLSDEPRAKRTEVEAGFNTMRHIFGILSAVRLDYSTACTSAAQTTRTADVSDSRPPADPAAGEHAGVDQAEGAPTQAVETAEVAPTVEPAAVPLAAPAPIPDGPERDRVADRERTPPPGNRAKAIEKMSINELVGPRKNKGGEAKAATKPVGRAATKVTA